MKPYRIARRRMELERRGLLDGKQAADALEATLENIFNDADLPDSGGYGHNPQKSSRYTPARGVYPEALPH